MKRHVLNDFHVQPFSLTLKPGMAIAVISDDGPVGPCGQSMSITCPHTVIAVAPDEDSLKEWLSKGTRKGLRERTQYCVIGSHGSAMFSLAELEEKP